MEKDMSNEIIPNPKRHRVLTVLLMLAVFASGVVIGGCFMLKIVVN